MILKEDKLIQHFFKKTLEKNILIVQIYVDDIIFGLTNASLCKEFSKLMQEEFEMSMIGELKFFLGIQINQCKDGVYVHQSKYTKELLKKFKLEDCKEMNTPMHPTCTLSKEDQGSNVDQKLTRSCTKVDLIFYSVYACVQGFNQILEKPT